MKEYDIELIEPKEGYIGTTPQGVPNSYSRKCTATDDLQPIVLYRKDLDKINSELGNQEGISYSQALPVDGRDKPGSPQERLYICPKYWDRKHEIPLSPKKEIHPILKIPYDDEGSIKGWKNYILPRGLPTSQLKNNDYFIFERNAPYWSNAKDNLDKYNIIFKSKCHPRYPIPCCGKKKTFEKFKVGNNVIIFINDKTSYRGEITKIMANGFYKVSIPNYSGNNKFHVSKLKIIQINYTYSSSDNFPLFEGEKGLPVKEINRFLNIELNIKETGCGLYRIGILQNNDSFLNALNHDKKRKLSQFKKDICTDIDSLHILDELIPLFRSEELTCKLKGSNKEKYDLLFDQSIKESKNNLKQYIHSDEYKDSYLLIPLFQKISLIKNNKTFQKKEKINLVVFEKTENKIIIQKPIGGFDYKNDSSFLLFFKSGTNYEPLHLKRKNDNLHCSIDNTGDIEEYIYFEKDKEENLEIKEIKENMSVLIGKESINGLIRSIDGKNYTIEITEDNSEEIYSEIDFKRNHLTGEDPHVRIFIYQNEIINTICNFTGEDNIINQNRKKEFVPYDVCISIMESSKLKWKKTDTEYIDLYHKITHLEFNKSGDIFVIPIKPRNIDTSKEYKPITDIPKIDLEKMNSIFKTIDYEIDDTKYKKYIHTSVNSINSETLYFESMLHLPIQKVDLVDDKFRNRIDAQFNITGNNTPNSVSKHMEKYFKEKNEKYKSNMIFLSYLRNRKAKLNEVQSIIQHDIMLKIHKRNKIYDILKKTKNVNLEYLPQFIEKLLINGVDKLQNIILNDFSLKDIMKPQKSVYIFKQFQIKNKDYAFIFELALKESKFIRDISQKPYK